jgi:NDP-sugar pyrophosphorylase family protein
MRAIILSGGLGLRLRPLTEKIPKVLISYHGKPMAHHQVEWLKKYGIRNIIFACGYKWEKIKEYFQGFREVSIDYSVEKERLGTGGAIKQAMKHYEDDEFIILNGDVLTDLRLDEFIRFYENMKEEIDGIILLVPFKSPYGVVYTERDQVKRFEEKPELPYWINGGIYILKRKVMDLLPDKGDIERETFPKLKLAAFKSKGYWKAIDTLKDLQE